jgi:POT family proton-dependent oligopeptide transporter
MATLAEVRQKEFLGHPIGLWALFTTEMWERFCYYGMRALLVLYLISTLTHSNPGFGWSEKSADELYGWFTGLVYLFPLLGGYIADRFIGQHRSVLLGGSLMALGEFCLFYSEYFRQSATATITFDNAPGAISCFMLGLFLITLGNGFFKPCISVMVGDLYEKEDPRRDSAFYIFYMGINLGAFAAPFVAGTIGEKISWHWGFLTAGIGMCCGLLTYSLLRPKFLGPIGMKGAMPDETEAKTEENVKEKKEGTSDHHVKQPLTRVEVDRIAVILTLTFFCIAFWSVFEQAGTSLNIFANKETNRQVPNVIGRNFPGFLTDEAALKAKIAKRNLEKELFELKQVAGTFDDDSVKIDSVDNLPEHLIGMAFEKKFDESVEFLDANKDKLDPEAVKIYSEKLANVKRTYNSALHLKDHANEAHKRAKLDELDLDVDDFEAAAEAGEQEFYAIAAEVETRLPEVIEAAKAKKMTFNEDKLRESLHLDIVSEYQSRFLANEQKSIDKTETIYTFPTTWYQSVNPLSVIIFAPLFGMMWGVLRRYGLEPSTPVKFGIGLLLLSLAFFILIPGAIQAAHTKGNAAAYWLLITYMLSTFGELCLSPIGLSMVSRLAPERYASLLMGVWFLSSAVAGYLSGKLAAVFGSGGEGGRRVAFFFGEQGGMADFFLIMALVPLCAGLIIFLLSSRLRKMMHEEKINGTA